MAPADPGPVSTGHDTPTPARTQTLPELPGLAALYARALAASGRTVTRHLPGGSPRPDTLPDVAYRVAGVTTDDDAAVERLTSYQRLLGEQRSDVLSAGYLHVTAFPLATAFMVRDDFPLPLIGLVHIANAVTVHRPVRLGETLEIRTWAQGLRPHRRGVQVDVVTEISVERDPTSGGTGQPATALAYRSVTTHLAKGATHPDATYPDAASTRVEDARSGEVAASEQATDGASSRTARTETFAPPLPTARWALSPRTARAYAAISGDRNPIHLSWLGARAFGFPRTIAHGMYSASRALAEVGPRCGGAYDWTVRFAKPVLLPGVVDVAIVPCDEATWDTGREKAAESAGTTDAAEGAIAYAGWNRSGEPHFLGTVTPRPAVD